MKNDVLPSLPSQLYIFGNNALTIECEDTIEYSGSSRIACQRHNYPCSGAEYQDQMQSCFDNIDHGIIPKSRKCPIEVNDLRVLEEGCIGQIGKGNDSDLNKCKRRKKMIMNDPSDHIPNDRLHGPVRTQKISDKITALQKLVSPYGKTDTASVLQETSIHIKILHEKLKSMFEIITSSHVHTRLLNQQKIEEENVDQLRRRGLCVIPVSIMENIV